MQNQATATHNNIRLAAFSADGRKCCTLTKDGILLVGSGTENPGFGVDRRIVDREPVDGHVSNDGRVAILTADGSIHMYDMHSYSTCSLQLEGEVSAVCKGFHPGNLLAVLEKSAGDNSICRIELAADGEPTVVPIMATDCDNLCCDPKGRYLATVTGGTTRMYDLHTMQEELRFEIDGDEPPTKLCFDESGEYFFIGGGVDEEWRKGLRLFRTGSWKDILSFTTKDGAVSQFVDVAIDNFNNRQSLVLVRPSPMRFLTYSLHPDDEPLVEIWNKHAGSNPMAVIPFTHPDTGKRKYWCKLWFQDFQLYDAETGDASILHAHWERSGIVKPEFISNDPRVVFPMEDGRIQITLKSDLYPVFDPRTLGVKVDKAVLNTDASRLYLLSDGKLYVMQLPAAGPVREPGH